MSVLLTGATGLVGCHTAARLVAEGHQVRALVRAAGKLERTLAPLDVAKGDRILYGKWSGTEVKVDGDDYLIMKESDIMGVIEGGAKKGKKAA